MNAAELAAALGGKRSGRQWKCCCPAHDDAEPSLIVFDGYERVQVRCLAGCTPRDIIDALIARGLWDAQGSYPTSPHNSEPSIAKQTVSHETSRHRALALSIFSEAAPLTCSPMAIEYLTGRGLPVLDLACARFHPRCPRGDGRFPAIVVRMDALNCDQPRGVQRIFLRRDGNHTIKDGAPMMLGDCGGAAMKLVRHADTFSDCLSYCPTLNIAEGFETALALLRDGTTPIWAVGSATAIASMPVLFAVGALTVWADHDRPRFNRAGELVNTGLDAGRAACMRWADAGVPARMCWPEQVGTDFADR